MSQNNKGSFSKRAQPDAQSKQSGNTSKAFSAAERGQSKPAEKQSKSKRHAPAPRREPRPSGMGETSVDRTASYNKLYAPEREAAQKARSAKAIKALEKKKAPPAKGALKSKFKDADKGRDT